MSTNIQTSRSQTERRAIELLGSGLSPSVVANAIGVSESRISQLMSEDDFKEEVTRLRYQNLQKHNEMDNQYDSMEAKVAKQLDEMLPLMTRPMELLKAASVLNSMKRRGQASPDQITNQTTVVQLLMPVAITQKFTKNINNQVINAGNQTLETIQGSVLLNAAKTKQDALSQLPPTTLLTSTLENTKNGTIEQTTSKPSASAAEQTATPTAGQSKGTGTASVYAEISPR